MADSPFETVQLEEDIDDPVPASELQALNEEKRILSSVYRHVEHQQVVEQVAGVAGIIAEDAALSANESKSPSSPWMGSVTQKTSSIPLSAGGSEESESVLGLPVRLSAGIGSTEAGDVGRVDLVSELLSLPQSLDSALRLNMALQKRFRDRILALESIFLKNVESQAKLKREIACARTVRASDQKADGTGKLPIRISHFCVPYFKNRGGMPAPMNDDAKMKVEKGYIDLYITRSRTWLTVERENLDSVVREEWKKQKLASTEMTVRELERKLQRLNPEDQEIVKSLEEDITNLKKVIKDLDKMPPMQVIPDRGEKQLDWDRIAARAFDGHRTPDECRLQWENYLHPDINTTPFTEREDIMIQMAVMNLRTKLPDYEKISKDMNTNRTAYQVMQRYVSFIEPALKPCRWTKKDSDKLLNTVNMLRVGNHIPWYQVHQHFVGFSRVQIQSRWRMIDPDISKGPFTVEEDFLLIKGLHMFGLNFDSIVHFMPGRTYPQVRDRYKRTILPSLSVKPWKKEEDAILIKECSVGPKNWRKMVLKLPRFNACQIRLRYHTIQVWQTLSKTNLIPPPLFPVTSTVNPEAIQEIRKAMILELPDLKTLVDESRKGIKFKNVLKELEERRVLIRERKSKKNMQKMKRVTEKRGRQAGIPNPQYRSVQDIFLTEFFIPFRHSSGFPNLSFESVQKSLIALSTALQLKIVRQLNNEDIVLGQLKPVDKMVLKSLTKSHVLAGDIGCAYNCPACLPVHPERSPLLPPCKTTIGAFKSLLVHRPKLKEMASGEFFLYKYNKNELYSLETHCRGRRYFRKRSTYTLYPEVVQPQREHNSEAEVNQDVGDGDALVETDDNSAGQGNRGQSKIHITYQARDLDITNAVKRPSVTPSKPKTANSVKAYSRGKAVKGEPVGCVAVIDLPTTSGAVNVNTVTSATSGVPIIKFEVNNQEVTCLEDIDTSTRTVSTEETKAREVSDSLLFQRMLSVFFWPALMTISVPQNTLINKIQEKIVSGELEKPAKPVKIKNTLDKDDLDMEAQAKYISLLSREEKKFEEELINSKKRFYERKAVSVDLNDTSVSTDVSINTGKECESSSENDDREHPTKKVKDGRKFNKYLITHHRKKKLKSLRRSLVMKRVWDARRKGSFPQRTSDRDKRNYQPRRSRTRDCVRKDMIKPPKAKKIWDFPLDGPMRVQPQAPAIPSEEMLKCAFFESTSNLSENPEVNPAYVSPGPSSENTQKVETKPIKRRGRRSEIQKPQEKNPNDTSEPIDIKSPLPEVTRNLPSLDIVNGKSNFRRKSMLKFVSTTADVHSATCDSPEVNLSTRSKLGNKSSVSGHGSSSSSSCSSISYGETVRTSTKTQILPPLALLYDEGDTGLAEMTMSRPKKVHRGKEVAYPPSTSKRVIQPSCKRSIESSFRHLLEDQIKSEVAECEESTLFDPEVISSNKDEMQVPIKKAKSSSSKTYQVSFQCLLDDEVQDDSQSMEAERVSEKNLNSQSQVQEDQVSELQSKPLKRKSRSAKKN
ncbi:uncharacterized protein LOC135219304 [Macrobrachium nipponense]|uniref:uncharacterized protein LOC135219304 n=1 Tax=Macrobrachium nipponense TaxID=159736 RepID=UPI0030C7E66F